MDVLAGARAGDDGFAVLPGFVPAEVLAPALDELELCFPSAAGVHDRTDPRWRRFADDDFAGIDGFPFAGVELSLLAASTRMVWPAAALLGVEDLRLSTAEGLGEVHRCRRLRPGTAPRLPQPHRPGPRAHVRAPAAGAVRVPARRARQSQPTPLSSPAPALRITPPGRTGTPPADGADGEGGWVATTGSLELHRAAGPAGTVVAFTPGPSTGARR